MKKASILLTTCLANACHMYGVRDEQGMINFGPGVFEDDPIGHRGYPSYAEYALATGELDELKKKGFNESQQLCYAHIVLDHLPANLRMRLNQYATGETTLLESEYAALTEEVEDHTSNRRFADAVVSDFRTKCANL